MNLHEYQTKQLLSNFDIPIAAGRIAETPDEAATVFTLLDVPLCAVKAQIHAGGRGKAGGIKLVKSAAEAQQAAESLLGKPLVTHQTGPAGRIVRKVYIEAGCDIGQELYLSCVLDRKAGKPVLMASREGGVDIEEVAARSPEAILKEPIDIAAGLLPFQARRIAYALGIEPKTLSAFMGALTHLVRAYRTLDCSLLEINPFVIRKSGGVLALDAKMSVDDRALPRHPELATLRDTSEEDPTEIEANSYGLSYVSMDGTIGCMVNGAGLAMSTMDIIQLHGGRPANFLDVGGGANKDQVAKAFKLLLANPNVRAVLINIFGGILKCDVLAQGIVDALKEVKVGVPVVVRLEGTNVEKGREILAKSELKIIPATDMTDAAKKVVATADGKRL